MWRSSLFRDIERLVSSFWCIKFKVSIEHSSGCVRSRLEIKFFQPKDGIPGHSSGWEHLGRECTVRTGDHERPLWNRRDSGEQEALPNLGAIAVWSTRGLSIENCDSTVTRLLSVCLSICLSRVKDGIIAASSWQPQHLAHWAPEMSHTLC